MLFWWMIGKLCLPHFTLFIIFIEIPDDAQIDAELYTLPNFLNQLLYNLTPEIYAYFPVCVCVVFFLSLTGCYKLPFICQFRLLLSTNRLLRHCHWHWTDFFDEMDGISKDKVTYYLISLIDWCFCSFYSCFSWIEMRLFLTENITQDRKLKIRNITQSKHMIFW